MIEFITIIIISAYMTAMYLKMEGIELTLYTLFPTCCLFVASYLTVVWICMCCLQRRVPKNDENRINWDERIRHMQLYSRR